MADLKFIVTELNQLINTDYNLISFDALPIANLMQILVDVLHDFGALTKVNGGFLFPGCLMMCEKQFMESAVDVSSQTAK